MVGVFLLGVMFGAFTVILFLTVASHKYFQEKAKKTKARDTVTERLQKVKDLTEEQYDMMQRTDGPQKNSLDGKYKNSVSKTIKDIEEEKSAILQSILADGFDPEITAMDTSGTVTKMKLSQFMISAGYDSPPTKPSPVSTKHLAKGKFTVVKGGKDDDSGNTTH